MSVAVCFYCGEVAGSLDHVVPLSRVDELSAQEMYLRAELDRLTVPSCQQCNSILQDTLQESLADRFAHLKRVLERRLGADLRCVLTSADLDGMRPRFAALMRRYMLRRDIARRRLAWPMPLIESLPPDVSVATVLAAARRLRRRRAA